MNSQQKYYSPFSSLTRKWMITIGSIVIAVVLIYALTAGVISYLNY